MSVLLGALLLLATSDLTGAAVQADVVVRDFRFHTGETLPELKLHYAAWGTPRRDAAGRVTNAVLLLHGTLGRGVDWGSAPEDAASHPLLGPGAPLDAARYYVVAPDTIGSGGSSKPSDGLRQRFPRYDLTDIVTAEHALLERLGIDHVVVIVGSSMGGRQAWQWAIQYPGFMDGIVPLVSSPFPNAGRRGAIDLLPAALIRGDPAWKGGDYAVNPAITRLAFRIFGVFMTTAEHLDRVNPTRDAVRQWVDDPAAPAPDANDFLYQLELNEGFDAWSALDRVRCPVLMINGARDPMVPVELHHAERVAARLPDATYLEIVENGEYGHGAVGRSTRAWAPALAAFLARLSLH